MGLTRQKVHLYFYLLAENLEIDTNGHKTDLKSKFVILHIYRYVTVCLCVYAEADASLRSALLFRG